MKDKRYTINKEFCGYPEKRFVLRFCGEFIESFERNFEAVKAAEEHAKNGFTDTRPAYYQYRRFFGCG